MADVSDLTEFGQIISALIAVFIPIIVVLLFLLFLLALAPTGRRFLGGLLGGRRFYAIFMFLTLALLMLGASPATATSGTTGNLDLGVNSVTLNTPFNIRCINLQSSRDYSIEVNDVAKVNWTTSSTQDTFDFWYTFTSSDVASGAIKVELGNSSKGPALDSQTLGYTTAGTLMPTGFLIELGVAIMIIGLVITLVLGLVAGAIYGYKRYTGR